MTWFRLAATMGCSVREVQTRVSAREFERWRALELLDPWWLPERIDAAISVLCSVVYGTARTKKAPRRTPADFRLDYRRRARQLLRHFSPSSLASETTGKRADELKAQFIALTVQRGGAVRIGGALAAAKE